MSCTRCKDYRWLYMYDPGLQENEEPVELPTQRFTRDSYPCPDCNPDGYKP